MDVITFKQDQYLIFNLMIAQNNLIQIVCLNFTV